MSTPNAHQKLAMFTGGKKQFGLLSHDEQMVVSDGLRELGYTHYADYVTTGAGEVASAGKAEAAAGEVEAFWLNVWEGPSEESDERILSIWAGAE